MKSAVFKAALGGLFALAAVAGWFLPEVGRSSEKSPRSFGRRTMPPSSRPAAVPRIRGRDPAFAAVMAAGNPMAQMNAALDLAASLSPADFPRLLGRASELPSRGVREGFVLAVLRRWVAVDPTAAVGWCRKNNRSFAEDTMSAWAERDPEAAGKYVERQDGPQSHRLVIGYLRALARRDPTATWAALGSHPGWDSFIASAAAVELVKIDPMAAIGPSQKLSQSSRRAVLREAGKELARRDFAGAMAWIRQQPDSREFFGGAITVAPDVRSAVEAIMALPGGDGDRSFWLQSNPRCVADREGLLRAVAGLKDDPFPPFRMAAASAIRSLAERDPQEAIRLVSGLGFSEQWEANDTIAETWAGRDPAAALAWARTLPEDRIRASTRQKLEALAALSASDPSPANRCLAGLLTGGRESALQQLRSPEDRAEALDAAAKSEVSANHFASSLYTSIGAGYPDEFAAWAVRQPESEERREHVLGALTRWSQADPATAAAWVVEKVPPTLQRAAVGIVREKWAGYDPDAAAAWVQALPEDLRQGVIPPGKDW